MSEPLVLLVPRDASDRLETDSLFEWQDIHVESLLPTDDVLDRVRALRPDVVVVPIRVGIDHGPRIVRGIRALTDTEAIPVLAISDHVDRVAKIELMNMGADDYVCRPADPLELRARTLALARRHGVRVAISSVRVELDRVLTSLQEYREELRRLMERMVESLEQLNLANDTDTGNHIMRVAEYSAMLSRVHSCPRQFIEQVAQYAGLHDVGKVGIRDAILKKPGALTPEEFQEMQTHSTIGAELLKRAGLPRIACNIALHHHERWNGRGYPEKLRGSSIPIEARIVAVADVYDACRNKRCYHDAKGHEQVRKIMLDDAGVHFDPDLVREFFEQEEEILNIYERYKDSAEPGG